MKNINFIAIDFETATSKRASICEADICVVKNGKVVETKSTYSSFCRMESSLTTDIHWCSQQFKRFRDISTFEIVQ